MIISAQENFDAMEETLESGLKEAVSICQLVDLGKPSQAEGTTDTETGDNFTNF